AGGDARGGGQPGAAPAGQRVLHGHREVRPGRDDDDGREGQEGEVEGPGHPVILEPGTDAPSRAPASAPLRDGPFPYIGAAVPEPPHARTAGDGANGRTGSGPGRRRGSPAWSRRAPGGRSSSRPPISRSGAPAGGGTAPNPAGSLRIGLLHAAGGVERLPAEYARPPRGRASRPRVAPGGSAGRPLTAAPPGTAGRAAAARARRSRGPAAFSVELLRGPGRRVGTGRGGAPPDPVPAHLRGDRAAARVTGARQAGEHRVHVGAEPVLAQLVAALD